MCRQLNLQNKPCEVYDMSNNCYVFFLFLKSKFVGKLGFFFQVKKMFDVCIKTVKDTFSSFVVGTGNFNPPRETSKQRSEITYSSTSDNSIIFYVISFKMLTFGRWNVAQH